MWPSFKPSDARDDGRRSPQFTGGWQGQSPCGGVNAGGCAGMFPLSPAQNQINTMKRSNKKTSLNRGSCEMRMMKTAGWVGLWAMTLASAFPVAQARAEAAAGPSDKMVEAVMNYAWGMLPAQFSNKDGNVIVVDKSKKESVMVPMDVAKEVVRVARISAHAQVCNLPDDQSLNHRSLMKREIDKKIWTDQQKLWINQLHLTTVMLLTGKIKVTEGPSEDGKGESKEVTVVETKAPPTTCTEEQKQAVKDKIKQYVDAGPKLPPTTVAAPPAPAATGSTTAPAATAAVPPAKAAPLPATAVPAPAP